MKALRPTSGLDVTTPIAIGAVVVSPGLTLSKDMKMKIYSIAGLYSHAGYVAEYNMKLRIYSSAAISPKPTVVRSLFSLLFIYILCFMKSVVTIVANSSFKLASAVS